MDQNGEASGQTGTMDAAKAAKKADAKMLILSHCGQNLVDTKEKAIENIGRIYKGRIIFAEELMKLDILL